MRTLHRKAIKMANEKITNPDMTFVFSRNKLSKDNPNLSVEQIDSIYDAMYVGLEDLLALDLPTIIYNVSQDRY